MRRKFELLPGKSGPNAEKIKAISSFWSALQDSGDPGASTWEVLDEMSHQVTAALLATPPDLIRAERITGEAMLLISWSKSF